MPEEQDSVYLTVLSERGFDAVRKSLEQTFLVSANGRGTASNPEVMWFEVTRREPQEPLPSVQVVKGLLLTNERLGCFQKVSRGAGAGLARQFDMFGSTG